MPYPRGDALVADVDLAGIGSDPLTALQARSQSLKPQQLLRIIWRDSLDESPQLYEDLAAFHRWFLDYVPLGSGYVLHMLPTPAQQGDLHRSVKRAHVMGVTWHGGGLSLVGQFTETLDPELLQIVERLGDATAEDIVGCVAEEATYTEQYLRTEISRLARSRVIGRHRRKLSDTGSDWARQSGRARFHYFPLWCADKPKEEPPAMPSEGIRAG